MRKLVLGQNNAEQIAHKKTKLGGIKTREVLSLISKDELLLATTREKKLVVIIKEEKKEENWTRVMPHFSDDKEKEDNSSSIKSIKEKGKQTKWKTYCLPLPTEPCFSFATAPWVEQGEDFSWEMPFLAVEGSK